MLDIPLNLSPRYQVTLTLSADDGQNLNLSADPADLLLQAAAVLRGEQGPAYPSEAAQAATEAARDAAIAAQTTAEGAADDAGAAATAASGYAATASGHAATASGYATDASDSATDAAASAGAASTSAGTATTQAGAAASSAASASASAATATTKAGEAAASAASAAGAVATALAAHTAAADPHPGYALDADLTAGLATKLNLTGGTLSGWLKMAVGSGHYLYNLDTDASNYERLSIGWASNTLKINAEAAGTGALRNLGLQTAGGYVGIGTASPSSALHIVSGANPALVVQANTNQTLFNFLKQDGSSLWRGVWDTANFHHYLTGGNLYYSLNGNAFTIDGNGNTNSAFKIQGSASLRIDPQISGSSVGIRSGDGTYATAGTPLTTNLLCYMSTWAWNGSNGYSVRSVGYIGQVQQSAAANDARLFFKNAGVEALSITWLNRYVGIGTTAPAEKLHVAGNAKATGYVELTEMAAPAAPATNDVRLYAEDNGSGKTRLMARFATGAAVQIAIEP